MPPINPNRRAVLQSAAAALIASSLPAIAQSNSTLHVIKDPNCGCCTAWVEIIEADGFAASIQLLDFDALQAFKIASGIPEGMASCHTAHVDGYAIEGHVPAADIRRLLTERPDAVGLSVPGMPYGSPGMGPEAEREAYIVYLIRRDGSVEPFASYDAA